MREIKQAPTVDPVLKKTGTAFDVELITPMYGGGARAGVNDPDFPIRPSSVRGQLRFWWRATRGARFDSSGKLFEEEKEIWGSTDTPSRVIVKAEPLSKPQSRPYIGQKDDNYGFKRFGPEAYVLFSASANGHDLVKEGLRFKIELSYDSSLEKDVRCAVWAWVNFGGIGARSRRGCGALYCEKLAPENAKTENILSWFNSKIGEYELNLESDREWPTLSRQIWLGNSTENALNAWKNVIIHMKNFRQGLSIGRNQGSERPGRSRWPEPDTLRRAFSMHDARHTPESWPDGFPRAAFGLPIIFSFKGSHGDPDSELYPKGAKRMGSPVILRPLKTRQGSAPLAVMLRSSRQKDLEVTGPGGGTKTFPNSAIVNSKFASYHNSPMNKRSAKGSAVEAFFAYLKESKGAGR